MAKKIPFPQGKYRISENVFKKSPLAMKTDLVVEQQRTILQRAPSISSTVNGLDAMERRNAAEWDDVSVASRSTSAKPKPFGGLGSSRFAVVDETKSVSSASEDMVSREEIAKMVDEKVCFLILSPAMLIMIVRTTPRISQRHDSSHWSSEETKYE